LDDFVNDRITYRWFLNEAPTDPTSDNGLEITLWQVDETRGAAEVILRADNNDKIIQSIASKLIIRFRELQNPSL